MLITPPVCVSKFLNLHGYDLKPNLLIIAENYPEPTLARYFYRSIYPGFIVNGLPSFSREIFGCFGVPANPENIQLHDFLKGVGIGGGRRLLIDALKDGAPPVHPISPSRLNDLIDDIINIDPNYILIMHNRNDEIAVKLIADVRFTPLLQKLLVNPCATLHPNIFPFPSAPANPKCFSKALAAVRSNGIPI